MPGGTKRRACSPSESPLEKKRGYSVGAGGDDTTKVSGEVVTARGTKRKASSEQESSKKRKNIDTSATCSDSTKESVESNSTTVTNDDQLSGTKNSKASSNERPPDPSPSPCCPSVPKQDKTRMVYSINMTRKLTMSEKMGLLFVSEYIYNS